MTAPMHLLEVEIPIEWVDYNDHLNDAYHAVAFSRAGDLFMERVGLGPEEAPDDRRTIYTLALVIRYLAEAKLGERLAISVQVLEVDSKRVRYWLEARRVNDNEAGFDERAGFDPASTGLASARASPIFLPNVATGLEAIAASHAGFLWPSRWKRDKALTLRRFDPRQFGDALSPIGDGFANLPTCARLARAGAITEPAFPRARFQTVHAQLTR